MGCFVTGATGFIGRYLVRELLASDEPVDREIRSAAVTLEVSAVSAVPVIREWVNARLREMVRAGRSVVVDGATVRPRHEPSMKRP